jgi:integrase
MVKKKVRLTDAVAKRLPTPKQGNSRVSYDAELPGFGCCVTRNGARSWVLNYVVRGRERRITIGALQLWRATAAREEAKRLKRLASEGRDPLAEIEEERAAPTVADLCDRFEEEHLPRKRGSTAEDYLRMLRVHIRPHFGQHAKVADVTFADVDALHRKITKAGHLHRANRTIAVLSKMFSLAIRWGMCEANPCKGIERNTEHHRRRYLSADELGRLVAALAAHPDTQAANIVRLLLLTGARRGEALAIQWSDVDLTAGVWSKPPSSTKQKQAHEAQLSAPARQLLSEIREQQVAKHPKRPLGKYVFPGAGATGHRVELKKDWRQLCKAAQIDGLRIHDLRHSFASQLVSSGASLPLIGSLLGHASPATTNRYAHMFADPQRAAVERVGRLVEDAGKKPAPEKVVPLKRGGAS